MTQDPAGPEPAPSGRAPARAARTLGGGRALLVVLGLSTAGRLAAAAALPLLEAEAYYWTWSRDLAAGYVDHPPGIAVLIRLGTSLLGHGVLGVRLGAVLAGTVTLAALFGFARAVAGPVVALRVVRVAALAPFVVPFGVLATPDAPLLAAWTVALWLFGRACASPSVLAWAAVGLATAAAGLSKYNGGHLPLVFLAVLATSSRGRRLLAGPGPWIGLGLAAACMLPNLLWNAAHGAATVATPFREGLELGSALGHLGQLVLLPFLLVTPLLALRWLARTRAGLAAGRWSSDDGFRLALCASWLPLAGFVPVAAVTQIHAHWVATPLLAALPVALDDRLLPAPRRDRRAVALMVSVTLLLVAIGPASYAVVAMAPARDGPWRRVVTEIEVQEALSERLGILVPEGPAPPSERPFLAAPDYHLASWLRWATAGEVDTLPLKRRRFRQFAIGFDTSRWLGRDAIVFDKSGRHGTPALLRDAFGEVEVLEPVEVRWRGIDLLSVPVWRGRDFRGPR